MGLDSISCVLILLDERCLSIHVSLCRSHRLARPIDHVNLAEDRTEELATIA